MASSAHIIEQLYCIFKMSSDPCEYPVGILTAEHRDIWAKSRVKLLAGQSKIPAEEQMHVFRSTRVGTHVKNIGHAPLIEAMPTSLPQTRKTAR